MRQEVVPRLLSTEAASRRALGWFLVIGYLPAWLGWIADARCKSQSPVLRRLAFYILPCGCSLAGFVAAYIGFGLSGFGRFSREVLSFRASKFSWCGALTLPLCAGVLTYIRRPATLLEFRFPRLDVLSQAFRPINFLTGPIAEEFGWRGFVQSSLSARYSTLTSGLLIGPLWSFWHLPLLIGKRTSPWEYVRFATTTTSWSVVLSQLVDEAGGSVWPAVAAHWLINNQHFLFRSVSRDGDDDTLPGGAAFCVASVAVACLFALQSRGRGGESSSSSRLGS